MHYTLRTKHKRHGKRQGRYITLIPSIDSCSMVKHCPLWSRCLATCSSSKQIAVSSPHSFEIEFPLKCLAGSGSRPPIEYNSEDFFIVLQFLWGIEQVVAGCTLHARPIISYLEKSSRGEKSSRRLALTRGRQNHFLRAVLQPNFRRARRSNL